MSARHSLQTSSQSYKIITQYGDMLVIKQTVQQASSATGATNTAASSSSVNQSPASGHGGGEQQHHQQQQQQQQQTQSRPVIMTFHDLGLNSELQFASFCERDEVKLMLQTFTLVHVNFMGQEFAAGAHGQPQACEPLPDDFRYPSAEQMAECIVDVCAQLRVRTFVALAVGAGAHIVSSLALLRPDLVHGLFLINPVVSSCSITEWLYFKMSAIASNHQSLGHGDASAELHCADQQQQQQAGGLRKLWGQLHHHRHEKQRERQREEADAADTATQRPVSDSRLRQLILSRNFRLASNQRRAAEPQTHRQDEQQQQQQQQQQRTRRPPHEYLMYHHFGSGAQQRLRRPSGDAQTAAGALASGSNSPQRKERRDSLAASSLSSRRSSQDSSSASVASHQSEGRSAQRRSRASRRSLKRLFRQAGRKGRAEADEQRQQQAAASVTVVASATWNRSNSLCLSPSHLAALSGERQRLAYMQAAYKHHFQQLNAHNLWLFAHSFVKRRTLSLRKDCGAAAHAAAAAAALGTSICAAFVGGMGAAPPPCAENGNQQAAAGALQQQQHQQQNQQHYQQQQQQQQQQQTATCGGANAIRAQLAQTCVEPNKQTAGRQQALVAGTKVKRTFTCQTLIMCSSVQLHCERALKLMALLNPLQATWIKTDQLLVLEEKPEKVCQALRLFLQGIGYSMSTYERRLRLSSAHASASSAESSNDSPARSVNLLAAQNANPPALSAAGGGGGGGAPSTSAATAAS